MTHLRRSFVWRPVFFAFVVGTVMTPLVTPSLLSAQTRPSLADLQNRLQALENKLACIAQASNAADVFFEGCNVHVRSGSGTTFGSLNGLGNLILGYNEREGGDQTRTGSHNLVIGDEHEYTSYAGIVAGAGNTIAAPYASVLGGVNNRSAGLEAVVLGGAGNMAIGSQAIVVGGTMNQANGDLSSILGGAANHTDGRLATIGGGDNNTAEGLASSITGGHANVVTDLAAMATIAGGDTLINNQPRTVLGATGPIGPKGDKGDTGDSGPPGIADLAIRTATQPTSFAQDLVASCADGEKALGGGAASSTSGAYLVRTFPGDNGTSWSAFAGEFINQGGGSLTAYVICGKVGSQ